LRDDKEFNGIHTNQILITFFHSCGSAAWTLELAEEYPNSHFVGIDFAPVVLKGEKPSNVEFVEYNVLDGLPFESNSFDYVYSRAVVAVYTRPQWTELAIPEYTRVTKPGGWVELLEIDGVLRGSNNENVQRFNNACKLRWMQCDICQMLFLN